MVFCHSSPDGLKNLGTPFLKISPYFTINKKLPTPYMAGSSMTKHLPTSLKSHFWSLVSSPLWGHNAAARMNRLWFLLSHASVLMYIPFPCLGMLSMWHSYSSCNSQMKHTHPQESFWIAPAPQPPSRVAWWLLGRFLNFMELWSPKL
jgi:hypothetical protein